jgi:hypothetical protein
LHCHIELRTMRATTGQSPPRETGDFDQGQGFSRFRHTAFLCKVFAIERVIMETALL